MLKASTVAGRHVRLGRHRCLATAATATAERWAPPASCRSQPSAGLQHQRLAGHLPSRSPTKLAGASPTSIRHSLRSFGSVAQPSLSSSAGGGGSSSSSSSSANTPPRSRLRQGLAIFFKSFGIYAPAGLFWASLVWGAPIFDLRTDEEVAEDEHEAQRLERFFDIDEVNEAEYVAEWTAKEEALSQVVEKLVKSSRFMVALKQGPEEDATSSGADANQVSWSASRKAGAQSVEVAAQEIEVSYVLPPFSGAEGEEGEPVSAARETSSRGGKHAWEPRLILAHRSGALALILLTLEHVEKGKDREEKWTCTQLRAELLTGPGGESLGEPLCDLEGHAPHGVKYMRI